MNFITNYSPDVFLNENMRIFHVTCVLHDCRQSARMEELQIQNKKHSWLSSLEEQKLTEIIGNIVQKKGFIVFSFHICGDHVHMILACEEEELTKIVQQIKGISARKFNIWRQNKGFKPLAPKTSLWAQKFNQNLSLPKNNFTKHFNTSYTIEKNTDFQNLQSLTK